MVEDPEIVVVNVKDRTWDHYIGRRWANFRASEFGNPFHAYRYKNREDCIIDFALWFFSPQQAELRAKAVKTFWWGEKLGCFCAPLWCHGNIIAGYVMWKLRLLYEAK